MSILSTCATNCFQTVSESIYHSARSADHEYSHECNRRSLLQKWKMTHGLQNVNLEMLILLTMQWPAACVRMTQPINQRK